VGGVSGPGPVREDPGDDGGIGDHGDDPHQPLALGAAERINFKDPAEQLSPTEPDRSEGPVGRLHDGNGRLGPGGCRHLTPPHTPGPAGVPAVVTLHPLAGLGDVGHQAGEKL
jgi:hypothetical protein